MGSLRGHRRVVGWLGIIAVLSNVLAGAICHAPGKAAGVVDDILGPLVLCTVDGAQTASHGGQDHPGGAKGQCSVYTLLTAFALAVAIAFAAIVFPAGVFHRLTFSVRTLADHLGLGGIRSRAPPLPA